MSLSLTLDFQMRYYRSNTAADSFRRRTMFTTTTTMAAATTETMLSPGPAPSPTKVKSAPMLASTSTATPSTVAPTLRSLYPRAARALLQRDVALAHSLISSAFSLLNPPQYLALDSLDTYRRKWDILRVTLETTVYVSPPKSSDPDALPAPLRSNIMMSGPSLIATLHTRSVRLFTPTLSGHKPKSAYLPAQILITLVLSSLKLECPDVGRNMIEDWLAQREVVDHIRNDLEGYEKVLDLFCLHVLPRLHDWEYASDFLEYESVLASTTRTVRSLSTFRLISNTLLQRMRTTLDDLRREEIEAARHIPTPPPEPSSSASSSTLPSPARTPSPAPSSSSVSSMDSMDTTSTRTVVPRNRTPRPRQGLNGISSLTPPPASVSNGNASYASSYTEKGKAAENGHASHSSTTDASAVRSQRADASAIPTHIVASHPPNLLMLVRDTLRPHLTASKLVFALLFVVVPLLSFVVRLRRKRARVRGLGGVGTGAASPLSAVRPGAAGSVVDVRRRLGMGEGQQSMLGSVWREVTRAVSDTVRMAGGGLV